MNRHFVVRSMTFQEDGSIAIEYVEPAADVKSNGVVLNHVCCVPTSPDYDDGIDRLTEAALDLLRDALDDADRLGPPDLGSGPDEDDSTEDEADVCPPCQHGNCEGCMGCEHAHV